MFFNSTLFNLWVVKYSQHQATWWIQVVCVWLKFHFFVKRSTKTIGIAHTCTKCISKTEFEQYSATGDLLARLDWVVWVLKLNIVYIITVYFCSNSFCCVQRIRVQGIASTSFFCPLSIEHVYRCMCIVVLYSNDYCYFFAYVHVRVYYSVVCMPFVCTLYHTTNISLHQIYWGEPERAPH